MLATLSLVMLLAETPGQTTMPRHVEPQAVPPGQENSPPTDPLFDKPLTASDDAAFILTAVESSRQGLIDARAGEAGLSTPELRGAAAQIASQQRETLEKLEALAKRKGWRLPEGNPERTGTVPVASTSRTNANFIVHQIAFHQSTVDQFRAQIAGKGDAELKRALRGALPGYQQNLQMLLGLKL